MRNLLLSNILHVSVLPPKRQKGKNTSTHRYKLGDVSANSAASTNFLMRYSSSERTLKPRLRGNHAVDVSAAVWLSLHSLTPPCSMAFYLEEVMDCTRSLLLAVSGWIPRHVIGAVLVSLPAISVLSHLFSSVHLPPQVAFQLETCVLFFAQNQSWVKKRKMIAGTWQIEPLALVPPGG